MRRERFQLPHSICVMILVIVMGTQIRYRRPQKAEDIPVFERLVIETTSNCLLTGP